MAEEKKTVISRREFLKDAGLVVGGATVGSMTFLSACNSTKTVTETAAAKTVTAPAVTTTLTKYVDPIDGTEYPTLDALKAHFAAVRPLAQLSSNFTVLNVNGSDYYVQVDDMDTLAFVLRDKLGFFGTKIGCDAGQCGVCTVLMDGVPVFACIMLAIESSGKKILTVEGLSDGLTLNKLQQKFYDNDAVQCGYCTPGVLMASTALLAAKPAPTADDVKLALSGHLCMCQNMKFVVDTVTGGV